MPNVIVVPVEGPIRAEAVGENIAEWQALVGGHLEFVPTRWPQASMYVNEDGMRLRLPKNVRAGRLCQLFDDYIKGDAVLFGMSASGEEQDCPFGLEEVERLATVVAMRADFGAGKAQ